MCLQQARDAVGLSHHLQHAGFHAPKTRLPDGQPLEKERRWLIKPLKSGGGHGVTPADQEGMLIVFIRDEVVLPNMGPGGMRYIPYLLTTFFYILFMNLIGLIPYGATPTGNIMVTAGLAIVAFLMIQISAIRAQGLKNYLLHLTGGVHWGLWIIMIPIEILGLFTKPFALCIRLFANMSAGHIVILSLIGLIFMFQSIAVAPVSVLFALFINMLELFVAALQAYIFTMLTSVFMGFGVQAAHENHEGNH